MSIIRLNLKGSKRFGTVTLAVDNIKDIVELSEGSEVQLNNALSDGRDKIEVLEKVETIYQIIYCSRVQAQT